MTDPIRAKPSRTHYVTDRGETVAVSTYLRRAMFDKLEAHAKAQNVTKAALVRVLVEQYLERINDG